MTNRSEYAVLAEFTAVLDRHARHHRLLAELVRDLRCSLVEPHRIAVAVTNTQVPATTPAPPPTTTGTTFPDFGSAREAGAPVPVLRRNYDYFDELDDKLRLGRSTPARQP